MAKKTSGGIERGDTLVMELSVAATWPEDGKVTVMIAGTRITFAEDNPEIREVLKAATEKARGGERLRREQGNKTSRGQARIGTSKLARILGD